MVPSINWRKQLTGIGSCALSIICFCYHFSTILVAVEVDCYSLAFFKADTDSSSGVISKLRPVLVIIIAYFIGSIPFGYLMVRARDGGDIRETGSGGTGATNASRRAGKVAGVITLAQCSERRGRGRFAQETVDLGG